MLILLEHAPFFFFFFRTPSRDPPHCQDVRPIRRSIECLKSFSCSVLSVQLFSHLMHLELIQRCRAQKCPCRPRIASPPEHMLVCGHADAESSAFLRGGTDGCESVYDRGRVFALRSRRGPRRGFLRCVLLFTYPCTISPAERRLTGLRIGY